MIKQIFKQIWTERRQNSWLLLELAVVFFFLLLMMDFLWGKVKNYMEPKGFDIENTYVLKLKTLESIAPHYTDPAQLESTPMQDLLSIADRIKLYPDIEALSVSIYSAPYSMGGFWTGLRVDTVKSSSVRARNVTASYFDVFRIRTMDDQPVNIGEAAYGRIILTEDMADLLYGNAREAAGKEIAYDGNQEDSLEYRVVTVSNRLKRQEFYPYEQAFFEILSTTRLEEWGKNNDITRFDLCVRIKPGSTQHFQDNFMAEMGDRLRENNVYVASIISSDKLRDDVVGKMIREDVLLMTYVMIFVLITVFMGVFGTFWLRTRQRKGEIGIRMAMGANQATIRRSMVLESLCLVLIVILPATIVYLNLLSAEILDVWRVPFTLGRVLIAFFTALTVMAVIVVSGTSWPARRAASVPPVEALRDE